MAKQLSVASMFSAATIAKLTGGPIVGIMRAASFRGTVRWSEGELRGDGLLDDVEFDLDERHNQDDESGDVDAIAVPVVVESAAAL